MGHDEEIKNLKKRLSLQRTRLSGMTSGGPPFKRKAYKEYLEKEIVKITNQLKELGWPI